MNKKFELIENDSIEINGHKLYRLRALIDFNDVKAGGLGGYVEHENNLSQMNDCWIYDNARVYDSAYVSNNAHIGGIASIFEHAHVCADITISGKVNICNNTRIF